MLSRVVLFCVINRRMTPHRCLARSSLNSIWSQKINNKTMGYVKRLRTERDRVVPIYTTLLWVVLFNPLVAGRPSLPGPKVWWSTPHPFVTINTCPMNTWLQNALLAIQIMTFEYDNVVCTFRVLAKTTLCGRRCCSLIAALTRHPSPPQHNNTQNNYY